jgi:hypothetical protein
LPRETALVQVAPTPPPSLIVAEARPAHPLPEPTVLPTVPPGPGVPDRFPSGECRIGNPTPLRSSPESSPLRCVRGTAPSFPPQGGVARLLAVADLTVKTNIRTARRATLGGTTAIPTVQAGPRGRWACEIHTGDESCAVNCEIRQSAPERQARVNGWGREGFDCLVAFDRDHPGDRDRPGWAVGE